MKTRRGARSSFQANGSSVQTVGRSRSKSRSLPCIGCERVVENIGDYAVGVFCYRCVSDDEKWEVYEAWKREQFGVQRPRLRRVAKKKDNLDLQIDALEASIRALKDE